MQGALPDSRLRIDLRKADIDHRLAEPKTPETIGHVEYTNRTIKHARVNRSYCETQDQLRSHLADFVAAYNFAKRLRLLKGLTP